MEIIHTNNIINKILVSNMDHSENDCFLIAVMTHGSKGKLYAYDTHYKYKEMWSPFYTSHCPSLKEKPKIFLIQACQGKLVDHGVTLESGFINNNIPTDNDSLTLNKITTKLSFLQTEEDYFPYQPVHEFHFLTVFSTPPGKKELYTN